MPPRERLRPRESRPAGTACSHACTVLIGAWGCQISSWCCSGTGSATEEYRDDASLSFRQPFVSALTTHVVPLSASHTYLLSSTSRTHRKIWREISSAMNPVRSKMPELALISRAIRRWKREERARCMYHYAIALSVPGRAVRFTIGLYSEVSVFHRLPRWRARPSSMHRPVLTIYWYQTPSLLDE